MYDTDYRESIANTILLIVENNDAEFHQTLREKVAGRIRGGSGLPTGSAEDYAGMLRHDGEQEVARLVMDVVRDTIYDAAMNRVPKGLGRTLLADLLDYGNVDIWEKVAYAYVPGIDDYAHLTGDPEADLY